MKPAKYSPSANGNSSETDRKSLVTRKSHVPATLVFQRAGLIQQWRLYSLMKRLNSMELELLAGRLYQYPLKAWPFFSDLFRLRGTSGCYCLIVSQRGFFGSGKRSVAWLQVRCIKSAAAEPVLACILVDPENRRKGYATHLVRGALEFLESRLYPAVRLNVFAQNPAMKLYLKLGFRELQRQERPLRDGTRARKVFMLRELRRNDQS